MGNKMFIKCKNSKGKIGGNAKSASETNILNHLICCAAVNAAPDS